MQGLFDLRMRNPVDVAQPRKAIEASNGTTAYIHCTAGLGRAPGVAVKKGFQVLGFFSCSCRGEFPYVIG